VFDSRPWFRRFSLVRHPFARRLEDFAPSIDGFSMGQTRSREESGNRTVGSGHLP
jgi:hypothetical protein